VLKRLENPGHVLSSANGTWVDRAEYDGMVRQSKETCLSALYGHVAESFSAGPLLGIAAVLLTGRMPALLGDSLCEIESIRKATGHERPGTFGVLCMDYTGLVSGAKIAVIG
jgi:hypothetical protein